MYLGYMYSMQAAAASQQAKAKRGRRGSFVLETLRDKGSGARDYNESRYWPLALVATYQQG